ncbi:MAG: alpha/beta hydrolase [Planctomycetes bacterium]|nr:alpha/beta hydrolase [Planctomycetota bacterium]
MAFTSLAQANGGEIKSRWTEIDSSKVHYLQSGPPTGLPVLLLHGGRFQAETWRKTGTLQALSAAGFHVVAVDLPGFGKTPKTKIKAGTWLGKLIDALHLDRPVVVSPSMSGRFAMPFVVAHSDRLRGFVAVAPVNIDRHVNALAHISVPLLAIWGEHDNVIPLSHADLLLKHVPHSRKVVVPQAGHALYMDDATTFHKELIRFLKQLEKP